jgi:hypothetical protein
MPSPKLTVRVQPSLRQWVEAEATRRCVKLSVPIRELLEAGFKALQESSKQKGGHNAGKTG